MLKGNELESIIYEKFEYIVRTLRYDPILFKKILRLLTDKSFVKNHTDLIINTVGKECIFSTSQILKNIAGIDRDKLNAVFEENKEDIVKAILKNSILGSSKYPGRWKNIKDEVYSYVPTVMIMIEEVLRKENKRWIDIDVAGVGYHTTAFQIGNKIMKIGTTGYKYEVPNHRRILQPLARLRIMKNKKIGIEIEEKVETGRFPIEDLYRVYKEVREDGIIMTDFKVKNVGRLIKPNIVHFEGVESVAPNAIGFDREVKKEEVLPAGELVVFDIDYIFRESDINEAEEIPWPSPFAKEMEERYQRERSLEASKLEEHNDERDY